VSVADEEADRDLLAVAAPIRGAEGRVIASIVVSGPARRLRERLDEVPAALQQHAIEVSAELGHVGPAPAAPRTAS
jgi:DNA-binding IclR family transcriptional regulator